MQLQNIISYYRRELNLSLENIGSYVGVSKSTVQRWESGESKNISNDKIDKLSQLFGVNLKSYLSNHVKPILGYIKAGYDLYAQENILGYEEVSDSEALKGDYYLKVCGDSMSGSRINDGDLVYIKQCSDVSSNDIAVVLIDHEEVTLKKVVKEKDSIILVASNPNYPIRIFTSSDYINGNIQILGKVLHTKIIIAND